MANGIRKRLRGSRRNGHPGKYGSNMPKSLRVLMVIILLVVIWNIFQVARLDLDIKIDLDTFGIPLRDFKHNSKSLFSKTNDVVTFDRHALSNVQATFSGAHSYMEWSPKALKDGKHLDQLQNFQAIPLSATVDRRPVIVRKQLVDDNNGDKKADGGRLLGCAISSTTFLSNLEDQYLKHYSNQSKDYAPQCDVCFQFSNREDMKNFVPGEGYEPLKEGQESISTKCFSGKAEYKGRFIKWQQSDGRFKGFGYPWTVDCVLPNGIQELTCRKISKMEKEIEERDDLQRIYFKTKITINGWVAQYEHYQMFVHSSWPWSALMSHDDDRSWIAQTLSKSFDDTNSDFVPQTAQEMKLMHVEGPVYDQTTVDGSLSLKSMNVHPESRGGLHFRLLTNLFHLIRNAPGSTHMIAVVDGQARKSYSNLLELLNTKVADLYPIYGYVFQEQQIADLQSMDLIPMSRMTESRYNLRYDNDLTLMELLRHRQIKIHMVPVVTPSMVFAKTVCGGQYQFATYLSARYAADYHAIMFIDGDTAMMEQSSTLKSVLYDRFFSQNSSKCAGHRLRLIEQYVKPEDDTTEQVLACTADLVSNPSKWEYAMQNCHLKEGHIVARTDSIHAFSVHHPDTLETKYLPEGVQDCITPRNRVDDRYFLKESEFVQLHLRNRLRKDECTCFVNQES